MNLGPVFLEHLRARTQIRFKPFISVVQHLDKHVPLSYVHLSVLILGSTRLRCGSRLTWLGWTEMMIWTCSVELKTNQNVNKCMLLLDEPRVWSKMHFFFLVRPRVWVNPHTASLHSLSLSRGLEDNASLNTLPSIPSLHAWCRDFESVLWKCV